MDLNFRKNQLPRNRMHLYVFREPFGLNTGINYSINDGFYHMSDVESVASNLTFLDIKKSAPAFTSSFYSNPGDQGSIFEYNNVAKNQIELSFWIHSFDHYSILMSYRDVCSYFSSQADYWITTSYNWALTARCVVNKISDLTYKSQYDALFTITMDNPQGLWFTDPTNYIAHRNGQNEAEWERRREDLPTPGFVTDDDFNWGFNEGRNRVLVLGDQTIKLSDPSMPVEIDFLGVHGDLSLINHTTNTRLDLSASANCQYISWYNLDVRSTEGKPLNQYSSSTDFWLSPGGSTASDGSQENGIFNNIELIGADRVDIITRFYFAHF